MNLLGLVALMSLSWLIMISCSEAGNSPPNPWENIPDPNQLLGAVSINGYARVGQTLTANTSALYGYGDITYAWKGESTQSDKESYTISPADAGARIFLTVTRSGYTGSAIAFTDIVAEIGAPTPGLVFTPIITGGNTTAYSVSKGTSSVSLVVIPSEYQGLPVTAIDTSGFASYGNLKSIIIPYTVGKIDNNAFFNCGNLTSITIPFPVTIGSLAFSGCDNLTSVYYRGTGSPGWSAAVANADIYYYAETDPGTTNTHWHLVGDTPRVWVQNQGLAFKLIDNGTAYSVSKDTASATTIIIPVAYEGWPVTEIAYGAFSGYSVLTGVTIPKSVTDIGDHAFAWSGLMSITIPNSVKSIGEWAFSGCEGLTSVTIPNGVASIGDYAFGGCSGLTGSITIPDSVTSIGGNPFYGCSKLTGINVNPSNSNYESQDGILYNKAKTEIISVIPLSMTGNMTIPDSVTRIGDRAFAGCSGLTGISMPNGVTIIGNGAFEDCSGFASITIPDSVTRIGDSAFSGCSGLTGSLTIPNGVTAIEYNTFNGCSGLTGITIPNSVTVIGGGAFNGCSGLTSITIPNGVTDIGDSAFNGCNGLTSITIPNGVTSIGNFAFSGCTGLTSIIIPDSVTTIGAWAFGSCNGLTSITIGRGVTSIDVVFNNNDALTSITVNSNNPNYASQDGILYNKAKTMIIWVPMSITGNITIPNGVTSIDAGASFQPTFRDRKSLTGITIPNSVISIGNYAFDGCSSLISVTIPDSVTSIEKYLFYNCNKLTSITIPNSITTIDDSAFSNCSSLASVTIPNSVESIGDYAFNNCEGLISITIPNSVTSIGTSAFISCSSLTNVTIGNSVMSIGNGTFSYCSDLTSITIPNSVTSIGNGAFRNCNDLTNVFYGGADSTAWSTISISSENSPLTSATRYYYSETNPGTSNTHWCYEDGVPTVWQQ